MKDILTVLRFLDLVIKDIASLTQLQIPLGEVSVSLWLPKTMLLRNLPVTKLLLDKVTPDFEKEKKPHRNLTIHSFQQKYSSKKFFAALRHSRQVTQ